MAFKSNNYIVAGIVSDISIRQAETRLGPQKYAIAKITQSGAPGDTPSIIPIVTFHPGGIKLLEKHKNGDEIRTIGHYEEYKNKTGKLIQTFSITNEIKQENPKIPFINPDNLRSTNIAQVGKRLVDLLENSEDVEKVNNTISLLLIAASSQERLNEVPPELKTEEILKREVAPKQTIFHEIAEWGKFENFNKKILTPENLSLKNENGDTPIHLVAKSQRLMYFPKEVITDRLLDLEDNEGNTIVHLAAGTDSTRYLPVESLTDDRMLKKNKEGISPILIASSKNNILSLPKEVQRTSLLLKENEDGIAYINLTSNYHIKKVVRHLPIETLNDYIKKQGGEKTGMGKYGLKEIENREIEKEKQDKLKVNELIEKEKYSEAKALINEGVDINQKNYGGKTPLYFALKRGNLELAELLVTKGAKLNTRDKEGYTILQAMIKNENPKAVQFLLRNGADIKAEMKSRNYPNRTTIQIAKKSTPEIKSLIESHILKAALDKNQRESLTI